MPQLCQSSQTKRSKIIAAIPCFNTEPFIGDVVLKARKYVDQVIVVDYIESRLQCAITCRYHKVGRAKNK